MDTPDFTGATWRKSSRSGDNGGQCVEVALASGTVGVRDSKNPNGPVLAFTPAEFSAFISGVTDGEFHQS